jgi:hypothetical protein
LRQTLRRRSADRLPQDFEPQFAADIRPTRGQIACHRFGRVGTPNRVVARRHAPTATVATTARRCSVGLIATGTVACLAAIAITGAFSVPRNDRLATFDAATPAAADYWQTFLSQWVVGNHVRTFAASSRPRRTRQPCSG